MEDKLTVIRYLLDEIEQEQKYNKAYDEAYTKAIQLAQRDGCGIEARKYMDSTHFPRDPRQSIIEQNKVIIRRIMLTL